MPLWNLEAGKSQDIDTSYVDRYIDVCRYVSRFIVYLACEFHEGRNSGNFITEFTH